MEGIKWQNVFSAAQVATSVASTVFIARIILTGSEMTSRRTGLLVCCLMLLSRGAMSPACSAEPQNAAVADQRDGLGVRLGDPAARSSD